MSVWLNVTDTNSRLVEVLTLGLWDKRRIRLNLELIHTTATAEDSGRFQSDIGWQKWDSSQKQPFFIVMLVERIWWFNVYFRYFPALGTDQKDWICCSGGGFTATWRCSCFTRSPASLSCVCKNNSSTRRGGAAVFWVEDDLTFLESKMQLWV